MSPYRARRDKPRDRPEPKPGLVADMVRQFADPYAFLRELVQNSMDAATTRIEVALVRSSDSLVRTSVTDDGTGMTPTIMENVLLTLFSSSKEEDPNKIGKYGVGFISVLAIDPDTTVVDTWREGGAWRARILRDHSWEIEELDPRPGSGTSVTLESSMDAEAFDRHAAACRASLLRWCRHASIPIHLSVTDYSMPGNASRERIDSPLAVHAVATVSDVNDADTIVVGPASGAERLPHSEGADVPLPASRFVGFYNRGLTLFETSTEMFEGLEGLFVKISSPDLKHTLSRDNVRREGRLSELLARARELAEEALPSAVELALKEQAAHTASGGDPSHYVALLVAASSPRLQLGPKSTWFPLADAVEGAVVMSAHEIIKRNPWRAPLLTATERCPLSTAFAATGRPIVLCPAADVVIHLASRHPSARRPCQPVAERHLLIWETPATDLSESDLALCEELRRVLGAVDSPVARVALAQGWGARLGTSVVAREPTGGIVSLDEVSDASTRWGKRSTLVLDVREDAVKLARERARTRLRGAAHLLARVILLDHGGAADRERNEALLADFARGGP